MLKNITLSGRRTSALQLGYFFGENSELPGVSLNCTINENITQFEWQVSCGLLMRANILCSPLQK